jgi:CDP-diacylglycerol--serine O-phosphatidyltransferase
LSLKKFSIPHHFVMPTLLGIGVMAAFLSTAPWPTMILIGALYLGSIPLTMRAAARFRRAAEAKKSEPVQAPLLAPPPPSPALGEAVPPPTEWRH